MELYERIQKEKQDLIDGYKQGGIDEVLNYVYEISFYNQVEWYFEDIYENSDEYTKNYTALSNFKGNLTYSLYDYFLGINNPEYYDFNTYNGIKDIVDMFLEDNKENLI